MEKCICFVGNLSKGSSEYFTLLIFHCDKRLNSDTKIEIYQTNLKSINLYMTNIQYEGYQILETLG